MISLLNLPPDVLEKILSYLSYDELSHCRIVCKTFDDMSQTLLNRGFHRVEKFHAHCLKKVKTQLPRRESERRKHPLSRHCDILTAIETRISLLGMTFMKFIELKFCCFIPGKVLDEIYRVLRYVESEQNPIRAHEVLQELRDLSSMAMEYFDEKIVPTFKLRPEHGPRVYHAYNIIPAPSPHTRNFSHHPTSEVKLRKVTSYLRMLTRKYNSSARDITTMDEKLLEISKKTSELEKKVGEQQNLISLQEEKIKEQDLKLQLLSRQLADGATYGSSSNKSSDLDQTVQKRKLRPGSRRNSRNSNSTKKLKR